MTYIKLDDGFHMHPKVVRLSSDAYRLYVGMLCYCSTQLTDGIVPTMATPALLQRPKRPLEELQAAGLIDATGDAWAVHDYLNHQRSRAEIEQQREAARDRAKRGRPSSEVRANFAKTSDEPSRELRKPETEGEGRVQRQSVTHPAPRRARGADRPSKGSTALDWFRYVCGREPRTGAELQTIEDLEVHGAECVAWGFTESIGKEQPERYAKRVFDACLLEGHMPRGKGNGRANDAGANAGGRGVRAGDGRGQRGASGARPERDALVAEDYDAIRAEAAEFRAAQHGVGAAAGDVVDDV